MPLSPAFLDELRARTTLSALIGARVKLAKAGREHKGCCPFHNEKTPSFTVSDEKGFYHCFGCGAHGDAIRWLADGEGMAFIDAVKRLAEAAGMEVPAPSPEAAKRETLRACAASVLEAAALWYGERLKEDEKALAALAARGVDDGAIARFGIGLAPAKASVSGCGEDPELLEVAGLLIRDRDSGLWRDRFRGRIMIPVHDARGRLCGFAGRLVEAGNSSGGGSSKRHEAPKYINSPDSPHFDKGDLLFNLHRAAPPARAARRLILVEGQFDVVAMDSIGIAEAAAPMGTALTERQIERAWRAFECPVLLFDGDDAGRKAALRAAERALPGAGPGRSLRIALMPGGEDPDSFVRAAASQPGAVVRAAASAEAARAAIEAVIDAAEPLADFVWRALRAELIGPGGAAPEARAGLWARLKAIGGSIRDGETRAQYLAEWRARFDGDFPPAPPGLSDDDISPDGQVADLSGLGERERARLAHAGAAWLERERRIVAAAGPIGADRAGRQAWEIGRRAGAGLVAAEDAAEALEALAGAVMGPSGAQDVLEALRKAFWYGCRRGGSLIEAMRADLRCAAFERTDMGNAERWHARFGRDYLYTTAKGWLGWDGRRYRVLNQEKDSTPAEVLASVFETVRAIQREARMIEATGWPEEEEIKPDLLAELEGDPRRPFGLNRIVPSGKKAERMSAKLAAWGRASESSGRLGCIAGLAKRWVTVELNEFDTDPMLLNCLNGTLRIVRADEKGPARVELHPHDRADRLTKLAACAYDPDAPAPLFQGLVKWAQPDRARRRYLRQWLGYNLTGDMGEQIFHIWYGPLAANGKSTVGNACREAIGDYGDTTNVETFLDEGPKKRGDAATPDIVRLPGVRFLTAGEPPKGAKINEPLINSVTGGDPMLARDNFRSFFRFLPIFKFTLWCNDLPAIPQGTAGIWRRVKVIPWEQHLEEHERDRDLPEKLKPEYPGVLAWMVRGLIDWMENGFIEPESVSLASADYKQDSDPLSTFLRVCTVADPNERVQGSDLYATFCAWAKAAGETEWKPKGFAQALKAKGVAHKHSNGTHWLGLKLVKAPGDFVDHEGRVIALDDPGVTLPAAPPRAPPGWEDDDRP